MKRMILLLALFLPLGSLRAQWSDNPEENKQLTDVVYYTNEIGMLPDGSFYLFGDKPLGDTNAGANHNHMITPFLYYFDKDGNPVWDRPIKFEIDSTMSYTKTMTHLMVDNEGNAIVAGQDLAGYELEKYTVWKVNRSGEFLWDARGISLHGGEIPDYYPLGALKMAQLSDGSYIFAWMGSGIMLQKISKDGDVLWGSGKNMGGGAFPYIVDAGDGDFIMVYQSAGLMARRLDFDGNDVWEAPVTAFSGELNPSIPLWTYLKVVPADGGVLLGYYGYNGDAHYPYISYIKPDGTHAFTDADAGLRIGYSDYWGYEPALAFDAENKMIYAIYQERIPGTQFFQRFAAQKINTEGELLWDPAGLELLPMKERATGYPAVSTGPKGTALFGFMENGGVGISAGDPIMLHLDLRDAEGSPVWTDTVITIGPAVSTKYATEISPYINDQWVVFWEDCRVNGGVDKGYIFAQNIRLDGSMGEPVAVEQPDRFEQSLRISPNPAGATARIFYNNLSSTAENVRISLVGLDGAVRDVVFEGTMQTGENLIEWHRPAGLASGMYILQMKSGGKTAYGKMILR